MLLLSGGYDVAMLMTIIGGDEKWSWLPTPVNLTNDRQVIADKGVKSMLT
jgi:hypothetical protein